MEAKQVGCRCFERVLLNNVKDVKESTELGRLFHSLGTLKVYFLHFCEIWGCNNILDQHGRGCVEN